MLKQMGPFSFWIQLWCHSLIIPSLTLVYRKPTHTDLYLHWDSHHHLAAKFSVINTLKHRAKTVCSNQHQLKEEEEHLNKVLRKCKYPAWALNSVNIKEKNNNRTNKGSSKNKKNTGSNNNPYIVVPYLKGMSEGCRNICRKHGNEMYFKVPPGTPQRPHIWDEVFGQDTRT